MLHRPLLPNRLWLNTEHPTAIKISAKLFKVKPSTPEKGEEARAGRCVGKKLGKERQPEGVRKRYDPYVEKPETVTKGGHTSGEAGGPFPVRAFPESRLRDMRRSVKTRPVLSASAFGGARQSPLLRGEKARQ